ncbi:MAG: hypothetical protein CVU44_01900 [Chloroflexi bacterium HGW-Chloroflexi-6]|nr:MAG: hypothetical protein CVU44_01900 [Chloroflexi bacterium HGW-Chloroflexi-6]
MKIRFLLPLILATLACSLPGLAPRPTVEPLVFPTSVLETVTPINTTDPLALPPDQATVEATSAAPPVDAATATLAADPLTQISISTDQIYYGGDCSPKDVTFEVTVSQPEKVYSVLLFVRLRNQKSGVQSVWNTGLAMHPSGGGRYDYKLRAVNVPSYKEYDPAWLQYQFVLTNTQGDVIGRTQIFLDRIKFQRVCP